jgi:hypothetical protein
MVPYGLCNHLKTRMTMELQYIKGKISMGFDTCEGFVFALMIA